MSGNWGWMSKMKSGNQKEGEKRRVRIRKIWGGAWQNWHCLSGEIKMQHSDMTQRWNPRREVELEMSGNDSMGEKKPRGLRSKPLRWFLQFGGWVSVGKKKGIWVKNWHLESIKAMGKRIKRRRDQQKMLHLPGCSFTFCLRWYNCKEPQKTWSHFSLLPSLPQVMQSCNFPSLISNNHVIRVRTCYFLIWQKTHSLKEKNG